jgi:hypothetical protein
VPGHLQEPVTLAVGPRKAGFGRLRCLVMKKLLLLAALLGLTLFAVRKLKEG